jgi:hypothetical protein
VNTTLGRIFTYFFFFVTSESAKYARVLFPGRLFKHNVRFAGKAYPRKAVPDTGIWSKATVSFQIFSNLSSESAYNLANLTQAVVQTLRFV